MNRSDAIGELAGALALAQGEMEGAKRDSQNPFFKNTYADLASVWDACRIPLARNGLSVVQTTQSAEGESKGVSVETILMHKSGEWISGIIFMPCAKLDAQSYGSALTYARRYALQAMVGIAPVDDDAEASMQRGKTDSSARPTQSNDQGGQQSTTTKPATEASIITMDVAEAAMRACTSPSELAKYMNDNQKRFANKSQATKTFKECMTALNMSQAPTEREPGSDDS